MGHTQQCDANTARLVQSAGMDDVGALTADTPPFVVSSEPRASTRQTAGHDGVAANQRRKHVADAPTTPKEEERIPRGDRRIAAGLCTLNLVIGMIFSVIAPFLPSEALERGVPTWTIGVMFAVLPITMLLASPFSGWVCTKWGPRVGIVSGTLIMALGVGAMGILQLLDGNAFVVVGVALRAVQGFGAALADTGAFQLIAQRFGDRMGTVMGFTETADGIGNMIGPPIGGALFELGGFYLPTTVIAGMVILLLPALVWTLPVFDAEAHKDDVEGPTMRQLLCSPSVVLLLATLCISFGALAFLEPVLGPQLESSLGVSPGQVGLLFALACVLYCVGAPIAGWVSDRSGPFGTVLAGMVLLSLSLFMLGPVSTVVPVTVPLQSVALGVLGLGAALALVPAMPGVLVEANKVGAIGTGHVPDALGTASALLSASLSAGEIVGPVVGSAIVDKFSFRLACVVYGVIVLLCGVALVAAKLKWPNTFLVARARELSVYSSDEEVGYGTYGSSSPAPSARTETGKVVDVRTHLLSGMTEA